MTRPSAGLRADRPVLQIELSNWKMPRVAGGQRNAERYRGGGDQTVCLSEGYSRGGVITSPAPGKLAVGSIYLDHSEAVE